MAKISEDLREVSLRHDMMAAGSFFSIGSSSSHTWRGNPSRGGQRVFALHGFKRDRSRAVIGTVYHSITRHHVQASLLRPAVEGCAANYLSYRKDRAMFSRPMSRPARAAAFALDRRFLLGFVLLAALPAVAYGADPAAAGASAAVARFYDGLLADMKAGKKVDFQRRFEMLAPAVDQVFDL